MPFLFYDKPQQRERKEDFIMKNERIYKLVLTALMAALSYVVYRLKSHFLAEMLHLSTLETRYVY